MMSFLRKITPKIVLDKYHLVLAWFADIWYGHPSGRLIVIGVTGTNGKTTTAYLISKALEGEGVKTGCITTALIKIGDKEYLNDIKMTMPGRFLLQKLLSDMAAAGCKYAVVETSSQGIVQHRHEHIAYDMVVFTNLTPEHIEAHGGFENYKRAKIKLFEYVASLPRKKIGGVEVQRAIVLNADDEHAKDFEVPGISEVVWYGTAETSDIKLKNIAESAEGVSFETDGQRVEMKMLGEVNAFNAAAAVGVAKILNIDATQAWNRLCKVTGMPGRFEKIDEGQDWTVIVDYAPEPASLSKIYETTKKLPHNKIIHVLGSCGGGRDVARRPVLGKMAGLRSDVVIVTNEDPYDDNPRQIMEQVAAGAREVGKIDGQNLFIVEDRHDAIGLAMSKAGTGDLVLMTGKGCEQWICVADGKKLVWDERFEARDAIRAEIAKRIQK